MPPVRLKRLCLGMSKVSGRPAMAKAISGSPKMRPSATSPSGRIRPVVDPALPGIAREGVGHHDRQPERRYRRRRTGFRQRLWHDQAAIVDEKPPRDRDAVARIGQRLQHRVVPEEQLQQQRDVADHLDIDGRQLAQDPVWGQPRYAHDEAEHRREDDGDGRRREACSAGRQRRRGHRSIRPSRRSGSASG